MICRKKEVGKCYHNNMKQTFAVIPSSRFGRES